MAFPRAYANCPICTPSRGTIFSGRHAHAGPVAGFFDVFKPTAPSTATELRKNGYHTAYFGKWHCGIVRNQIPASVSEDTSGLYKGGSRNRTPESHRAGFQDWFGFENLNQHFNSSIYELDNVDPTPLEGYETDALTDRGARKHERSDRAGQSGEGTRVRREEEEHAIARLAREPEDAKLVRTERGWRREEPWNDRDLGQRAAGHHIEIWAVRARGVGSP